MRDTSGDELCATPILTWVDDVSVVIFAEAASLVQRTSMAAAVMIESMQRYGFEISTGPSKTAAILHFQGRGAVLARQRCDGVQQDKLHVMQEHTAPCRIPIVASYTNTWEGTSQETEPLRLSWRSGRFNHGHSFSPSRRPPRIPG